MGVDEPRRDDASGCIDHLCSGRNLKVRADLLDGVADDQDVNSVQNLPVLVDRQNGAVLEQQWRASLREMAHAQLLRCP
jgi:hypothetical protein